ncbi:hypothetical protein DVH24_007202 [Malus domestica]|uniref:Cytochrome P450 n=1 Tax=Malus domestica TaxID=3750 RepID=A0A498HEQ0_MALDO|nr:hypothetical protein DVH24_007202 [Malus domestica]
MEDQESNILLAFSSQDGVFMVVCRVLSWIIIHRWSQRHKKGPKTWPLVGAAIEQFTNYDRMHDWLVKYLSESNSVVVPMPFTTYTYIADPANVEHVLKTNFANYPKGEVYRSYMKVLLGDGIFNVDGELWRKQRKTASFEFASQNLRDFSTVVFRDYSLKLHSILSRASFQGQQVDMQVGFGVEIGTLAPNLPDNHFAKAFDTAKIIVTLRFIDPLWRIKRYLNVGSEALLDKSIKTIDNFTYSVIQRRKAEIKESQQSSENKVTRNINFLQRDGTGRNGEGAKMPSDGNKEEEEGDGNVIILYSTDVERVVPGGEAERKFIQNSSRGTAHSTHFRRNKRGTERLDPFRSVPSHLPNDNLLSRFIKLDEDSESNLTDKSLRDVLNVVIAGRDTTATTLSWAIYMAMTHPHVADKLYSEMKTFEEDQAREEKVLLLPYDTKDLDSFNRRVAQFAGLLSYDLLGKLYYLHAVITETLRLYPAVPLSNLYGARILKAFWRMMFYRMEPKSKQEEW